MHVCRTSQAIFASTSALQSLFRQRLHLGARLTVARRVFAREYTHFSAGTLPRWASRAPGRLALVAGPSASLLAWWALKRDAATCVAAPHQPPARAPSTAARLAACGSLAYRVAQIVRRAVYLALLFTPLLLLSPLTHLHPAVRRLWQRLLEATMRRCGPAFIKWGQWAATRPDLLPADTCAVLERLQAAAPMHSFAVTQATIEAAFGVSLGELFVEFSEAAIASGAIAQVHRARLSELGARITGHPAGQEVAVKVRHPHVTKLLELDFQIMVAMATLASRVPGLRDYRLDDSMRQFGAPLHQQLDLGIEAGHLERFRHNFRLWSRVRFPRPLWPLVREDVLVETFEAGVPVSAFLKTETPFNARIAELGLRSYLQMILVDNLVHADLHPGNILVRVGPEARGFRGATGSLCELVGSALGVDLSARCSAVELSVLDVGMTTQLRADHKEALIGLYKGLSKLDGTAIAESILQLRHMESSARCDFRGFQQEIEAYFAPMEFETLRERTQEVMAKTMDSLRRHRITIDAGPSTVLITTFVLEGWSSKLDPDIRILDTICDLLPQTWFDRIPRTVDRIIADGALDFS